MDDPGPDYLKSNLIFGRLGSGVLLEKTVDVFVPLLYKISGIGFPFAGRTMEASEGDRRWGEEWCQKLGELVRGGKVKGNPVRVMGGLESVEEGFRIAREGKVHAQKLVYEVCKE